MAERMGRDVKTAARGNQADRRGATEPQIQYAVSGDGVRIAYWTLGEGTPLVYLAGGPWSHVESWSVPECRRWYTLLARDRMLVRYDVRGTGWSEREATDYSLEALVGDAEAVVDRLGLRRFDLLGAMDAGPVAIAYAARHPERVSRLVLWCAWTRGSDIASPHLRAWRGLLDQDWELLTDTCAHLALGWSAGEIGRLAAQRLRVNVTRDGLRSALDAAAQVDVAPLLARIGAPTLVLHRRDIPWLPIGIAQELASRLSDARLTVLEGDSTAPYLGDTEAAARAIYAFLREARAVPEGQEGRPVGVATAAHEESRPPGRSPGGAGHGLTAREVEVLRLLAGGRTNAEIAEMLVLSVRTVERHAANIYAKLGARGRADATALALTGGVI